MEGLFERLGLKLLEVIANIPLSTRMEINKGVDRIIKDLKLRDVADGIMTALVRVDRVLNETSPDVPPNLANLRRWYNRFGQETLSNLLRALQKEKLHKFLVENSLPEILRDPANFFCGENSTEKLLMYFGVANGPFPLEDVKALCRINWINFTAEFDTFFLENTDENRFDLFELTSIINRMVDEVLLEEASKTVDTVMKWVVPIFNFTTVESSIET